MATSVEIPKCAKFYTERTNRFRAYNDPYRLGIDGKPSRISEILYYRTPDSEPLEFAHCWQMRGWGPEREGQWTMNRSDVCIENEWWASVYFFPTLQALLDHLEATFVEGVPSKCVE